MGTKRVEQRKESILGVLIYLTDSQPNAADQDPLSSWHNSSSISVFYSQEIHVFWLQVQGGCVYGEKEAEQDSSLNIYIGVGITSS